MTEVTDNASQPAEASQMVVRVDRPAPALLSSADNYISNADALVIDCADLLEIANSDLEGIVTQKKTLETTRLNGKRPLMEAISNWDGLFNPAIELLKRAETIYKSKIATFLRHQQELAAVEQKRLDDLARAEQQRLKQEAEEQQREAENARAEAQRKLNDEAREMEAEETRKRQEALALASSGNTTEAERLNEQADEDRRVREQTLVDNKRQVDENFQTAREGARAVASTAAVLTAPRSSVSVMKPKGVSIRQNWKAEVTDLKAVIRAVADGVAPSNLLQINESAMNQMAKAQQAEMKIPGIRVWPEDSVSKRTAKA